jgi:hypothetical protein
LNLLLESSRGPHLAERLEGFEIGSTGFDRFVADCGRPPSGEGLNKRASFKADKKITRRDDKGLKIGLILIYGALEKLTIPPSRLLPTFFLPPFDRKGRRD